VKFQQISTV